MRRTIFTTSLLSALSCFCTQGYSQVAVKPVPDQSLIGQASDNVRNAVGNSLQQGADQLRGTGNANVQANTQVQPTPGAGANAQSNVAGQTNVTGQLQNQANTRVQGNLNGLNAQTGINSQAGLNPQVGRTNSQTWVNGQAGVNGQNAAIAGAQQRGGQYLPNQSPQKQMMQGWQNAPQSPMDVVGNTMPNAGMMAAGMQSVGPVYLLQYEPSGREFICVNGSRVYFDQPGTSQSRSANQLNANTGAVQEQRRAGYGNYDQAPNLQAPNLQTPDQPSPAVDPRMNKDSTPDPRKDVDAKPEAGTDKPNTETETTNAKEAPTLK